MLLILQSPLFPNLKIACDTGSADEPAIRGDFDMFRMDFIGFKFFHGIEIRYQAKVIIALCNIHPYPAGAQLRHKSEQSLQTILYQKGIIGGISALRLRL